MNVKEINTIIKYIPLQQGLRHQIHYNLIILAYIIKYIPLQQGLRHPMLFPYLFNFLLLSIFHYNKD